MGKGENYSSKSGKGQRIYFESGKIDIEEKSGENCTLAVMKSCFTCKPCMKNKDIVRLILTQLPLLCHPDQVLANQISSNVVHLNWVQHLK